MSREVRNATLDGLSDDELGVATRVLDGIVNLMNDKRNEASNRARYADSYAIPATPVISAQI